MVDQVWLSKKMSYVLRHNPGSIDIELDKQGWVDFEQFVDQLRSVGGADVDRDDVVQVIIESDKQRFQLEDSRIRAAQGHSIDVDLGLTPTKPPPVLWHGTVERFIESIWSRGLVAGGRTHVHMSDSLDTATAVGARRGQPVILAVDAMSMHHEGHDFYQSANGVWLAEHVPSSFISLA